MPVARMLFCNSPSPRHLLFAFVESFEFPGLRDAATRRRRLLQDRGGEGFCRRATGDTRKGVNDSVRLLHGLISCRPPEISVNFTVRTTVKKLHQPIKSCTKSAILLFFFLRITEIRKHVNISFLGKIIVQRLFY